jgi:hypothetical protein
MVFNSLKIHFLKNMSRLERRFLLICISVSNCPLPPGIIGHGHQYKKPPFFVLLVGDRVGESYFLNDWMIENNL